MINNIDLDGALAFALAPLGSLALPQKGFALPPPNVPTLSPSFQTSPMIRASLFFLLLCATALWLYFSPLTISSEPLMQFRNGSLGLNRSGTEVSARARAPPAPPPYAATIDVFRAWNRSWVTFDPLSRDKAKLSTCALVVAADANMTLPAVRTALTFGGPLAPWYSLAPVDLNASWPCSADDIQWLVRCPACNSRQSLGACDWVSAWTRRCGAARAYIPPVHYGELPAPELEKCMHDHFFITIGDCNVRSLLAFALDALDRMAPPDSRPGALPFIELGHHMLIQREKAYSHARYRAMYRYYPEPADWNLFDRKDQPTFDYVATTLVDSWRPMWDFHGFDSLGRSTVVFFIGGTGHPFVEEMESWISKGCQESFLGCPWLNGSRREADGAPFTKPRVIAKSPPARWSLNPAVSREFAANKLLASRALGFEWLDAWATSFPVLPFLGSDPIHFDNYNVSKGPGFRTAGPLTLALTNRLLESVCGVLTEPAGSARVDPLECWQCTS